LGGWRTWAPFILIVIGVVLRVWWLTLPAPTTVSVGETTNVARAFAERGVIADAFFVGQGPTAHVMPIPVIFAGCVYRIFGFETPLAEGILTAWSLALVSAAFWMLYLCFEELGSPLAARLGALASLCVLPLNFSLEAIWFRTWDGGLAAFLGGAFFLNVLRVDRREVVGWRVVLGTSLLAALLLFVSPPLGAAGYLCGLILLARKTPFRAWPGYVAIVLAATCLVLAPWTIRNAQIMGSPVVLRDNFGLEFAQANYSAAVSNPNRSDQFALRHAEIHPYQNPPAERKLIEAGGELKYSKKLSAETKAWVADHPADFAKLSFRHFIEFVFPPHWYWSESSSRGTEVKQIIVWTTAGLAILGLIDGLLRKSRKYAYVVIMTLVPIIPYVFVQPILRYRYIIAGLLTFLAWDLLLRLAGLISVRRRSLTAGLQA
jgi:hypothetical protein